MVIDNIFGLNSATREPEPVQPSFLSRFITGMSRQFARGWCGLHGHLILLHFEPNKLSLQCALCGYESEGWEVGRPLAARRASDARPHVHTHPRQVVAERRRNLRAVPSPGAARLAS